MKQEHTYDNNDRIFWMTEKTLERNHKADCTSCNKKFENTKDVKFCEFCGCSSCKDCLKKTRFFYHEKHTNRAED